APDRDGEHGGGGKDRGAVTRSFPWQSPRAQCVTLCPLPLWERATQSFNVQGWVRGYFASSRANRSVSTPSGFFKASLFQYRTTSKPSSLNRASRTSSRSDSACCPPS